MMMIKEIIGEMHYETKKFYRYKSEEEFIWICSHLNNLLYCRLNEKFDLNAVKKCFKPLLRKYLVSKGLVYDIEMKEEMKSSIDYLNDVDYRTTIDDIKLELYSRQDVFNRVCADK